MLFPQGAIHMLHNTGRKNEVVCFLLPPKGWTNTGSTRAWIPGEKELDEIVCVCVTVFLGCHPQRHLNEWQGRSGNRHLGWDALFGASARYRNRIGFERLE